MGYQVNFDTLDALLNRISPQSGNWLSRLNSLNEAVESLSASENIKGEGADNIKQYLAAVHGTIAGLLANLISLHSGNFLLYKQDYHQNIDTDLHANIKESELNAIKRDLEAKRQSAININGEAQYALQQVRDIFCYTFRDVSSVDAAHQTVLTHLNDVNEKIKQLEQNHLASDFTNTEELIASLKQFIAELSTASRNYKSGFSQQTLASSSGFRRMYDSYLAVEQELNEKADSIDTAIENENQRAADLQKEYEERQKKAQVINWIVTGVCIIGSIAAIAATGGAATPLVVAGISAASSAVIAGTKNATSQYVQNGSLKNFNWNSFGKDVVVGAATGFVTGYVGASVGGAITSGLSNTAVGSTLLNSSNALVRFGTGAVIGSVSEVGSGIVSRGASGVVQGLMEGNLSADTVLDQMFDGKSILFDTVLGGASGGVGALKKPVGREISVDDLDKELLRSKPKNSPNPEKWIKEKGGKIFVDGNGTWTYQSADGVNVVYSDGCPDFKRAGLVEDTYDTGGFDTSGTQHTKDIHKAQTATGKGGKGSGMTWHHAPDGKTLQLVPTEYHDLFRHRGGFSIAKGG